MKSEPNQVKVNDIKTNSMCCWYRLRLTLTKQTDHAVDVHYGQQEIKIKLSLVTHPEQE